VQRLLSNSDQARGETKSLSAGIFGLKGDFWNIAAILAVLFFNYYIFIGDLYFASDDYYHLATFSRWPLGLVLWTIISHVEYWWGGYPPLHHVILAICTHLFGLNPVGYHLVDLAFHTLNAVLVYLLATKIARNRAVGLLAGMIFAIHPSHNEALLWISANKNPIAEFWALGALLLAIQYMENGRKDVLLAFLSACLYTLAISTFEATAGFIVFVFAYDVIFIGKSDLLSYRKGLWQYTMLLLPLLCFFVLRWIVMIRLQVRLFQYQTTMDISKMLLNLRVLAGELFLLQTSPDVAWALFQNTRPMLSAFNPLVLFEVMISALIAAFTVRRLGKCLEGVSTFHAVGGLTYAITWLSISFLPFMLLFNQWPESRYTYNPSVGLALLISLAVAIVIERTRSISPRLAASLAFLAIMILLSLFSVINVSEIKLCYREAGLLCKSVLAEMKTKYPDLPNYTRVYIMGVPRVIGTARVFAADWGVDGAVQLLYPQRDVRGGMYLSSYLDRPESQRREESLLLLIYDPRQRKIREVKNVKYVVKRTSTGGELIQTLQAREQAVADFSGMVSFVGHDIINSAFSLDKLSEVELENTYLVTAWRLSRPLSKDYTLFIHFVNARGEIVAQADHLLAMQTSDGQSRPTSEWPTDVTVLDYVPLPSEVLSSQASVDIRIGLWIPETTERLAITTSTLPSDRCGRLIIGQYRSKQ